MVHVTLEASTERELKEKLKDYLKQYPSAGYGTHAYPPYLESYSKWKVKIERASSCD
jgi:hypothetical protein